MSWSVAAVGRGEKLTDDLKTQFARIKCAEPEQTIANGVRDIVIAALTAMDPATPVRVSAGGSQGDDDWNRPADQKTGKKTDQFTVSLEPIWNFVE